MILSCSWISLSCLSRSVISLSWPSFCVLRTFFRLLDTMIVSFKICWLYFHSCFHFDGPAYFCVLYSLFIVAVSRNFSSFRLQVSCWWWYLIIWWLVNCLSYYWRGLLKHPWLRSWRLCRLVCVLSRIAFSVRVGIKSSLILFVWHLILVASLVINCCLSTSTSNLMLLIAILWSLPVLTWLMTVSSVTMFGLFLRMLSNSFFVTPFGLFYVHLLPAFFWNMVFMSLYFLDVAHSTKVSPLSFLNSIPYLVSSFPYLSIEVSHLYRVVVRFP